MLNRVALVMALIVAISSFAAFPQSGDIPEHLYPYLQLLSLSQSYDLFFSFAEEGRGGYAREIGNALMLEAVELDPGQGIVVESRIGDDLAMRFHKARVATEADGSHWWQIEQSQTRFGQGPMETILLEVLVSREGFPLTLRYRHPESGSHHEEPLLYLPSDRFRRLT